jgi:hypothetical protein
MMDMFHQFQASEIQAKGDEMVSILLARGWRIIDGFERYLVSDSGLVYSSIRAGRFLSPTLLNTGYEYVSLMATGAKKPTKMLVHRLVAQAFCEGSGRVVNHKDGNKRNNHCQNLEWCSYAENNDHARDAGLVKNFGSQHYAAKLKAPDVLDIRRRAASGERHADIASDYGLIRQTVQQIAAGKRWKRVK